MLARSAAALPVDRGWTYEVKWDGFRAIVSAIGGQAARHCPDCAEREFGRS
jgi:ATP-dependent DNA ligase